MAIIRKLTRQIKRLIRVLDIDDIPPASLFFLGGCLILALIGYFSWRSDQKLLTNGREIQAQVIDRYIRETMDCDGSDCTSDTSYVLKYLFQVDGEAYTKETAVDRGIYDRAESSILIRYLPDRPSTSNVAETVENVLPFPLFSLITILVGLIGAAVIYFIQS
jgi:hypothetical protein